MRWERDAEGKPINMEVQPEQFITLDGDSEPFIANRRGDNFEDTFAPRVLTHYLSVPLPWGKGGPRNLDGDGVAGRNEKTQRDFTLRTWARLCLLRFGRCWLDLRRERCTLISDE